MLKGIPDILSPELLKILMEMGHGDDIVIGDINFPAATNARNLVRCNGHDVSPLLNAILSLFPLDTFVSNPVSVMKVVGDQNFRPHIWDKYHGIVKKYFKEFNDFEYLDRFDFYKRTKEAYAVIATSEPSLYGCVILKKGVI